MPILRIPTQVASSGFVNVDGLTAAIAAVGIGLDDITRVTIDASKIIVERSSSVQVYDIAPEPPTPTPAAVAVEPPAPVRPRRNARADALNGRHRV